MVSLENKLLEAANELDANHPKAAMDAYQTASVGIVALADALRPLQQVQLKGNQQVADELRQIAGAAIGQNVEPPPTESIARLITGLWSPHRLSMTQIVWYRRGLEAILTVAAIVLAVLLGLKLLWASDPTWGSCDDWLTAEKVAAKDRHQSRVAMLRYHGQGGEVTVPWPDSKDGVERAFASAHQGLYGFTLDAAIELVTLRVEATGKMPAPPRPMLAKGRGAKPRDRFPVHFESGVTPVPLYDRAALGAGDTIEGPAIVSQLDATTLVRPGWSGEVDRSGAILLTRG